MNKLRPGYFRQPLLTIDGRAITTDNVEGLPIDERQLERLLTAISARDAAESELKAWEACLSDCQARRADTLKTGDISPVMDIGSVAQARLLAAEMGRVTAEVEAAAAIANVKYDRSIGAVNSLLNDINDRHMRRPPSLEIVINSAEKQETFEKWQQATGEEKKALAAELLEA